MWCGCIQNATQELSKTAATNKNAQQNSPNVTARCCCQRYRNIKFKRNKHHNNSRDSINFSNNKIYSVWGLTVCKLATASRQKHKISTHINLTLLLATMTLAVLLQQQQITASPLQHTTTVALAASPSSLQPALRIGRIIGNDINMQRLRKRHSNWHEQYAREMNSQEIEWANPCGGEWHQNLTELPVQPHRTPVKKVLRMLQNSTGKEQKTIKAITPAINISDMRMWSLHKDAYKFLPVLKLNSSVALRRWHRQLQLYVASFAYLRRAQMKWDHVKLQRESEISKELLKLKQSARSILCEIETAINNTSAQGSNTSGEQKRHLRLNFLTRDAVEKRLKFQTNIRHLYAQHQRHQYQSGELQEVNPIDLKFVKFRYFGFLRAILKILRAHTRRTGEVSLDSRSASSASAAAASASKQDDSILITSLEDSRAMSTNSLEMTLNQSQNNTSSKRNKPARRRKNNKRNNGGNSANISRNTSRNTSNRKASRKAKQQQPA